jgi:hypothetical protein
MNVLGHTGTFGSSNSSLCLPAYKRSSQFKPFRRRPCSWSGRSGQTKAIRRASSSIRNDPRISRVSGGLAFETLWTSDRLARRFLLPLAEPTRVDSTYNTARGCRCRSDCRESRSFCCQSRKSHSFWCQIRMMSHSLDCLIDSAVHSYQMAKLILVSTLFAGLLHVRSLRDVRRILIDIPALP